MRLVAGQKYVRGPAGEIMPYTPAVAKMKYDNGTPYQVFIQDKDQADSLQLPENESLPRFRGRRMVDMPTKVEAKQEVQPVKKRPVPVQASSNTQTFEHIDITKEMDYDLKNEGNSSELAELE